MLLSIMFLVQERDKSAQPSDSHRQNCPRWTMSGWLGGLASTPRGPTPRPRTAVVLLLLPTRHRPEPLLHRSSPIQTLRVVPWRWPSTGGIPSRMLVPTTCHCHGIAIQPIVSVVVGGFQKRTGLPCSDSPGTRRFAIPSSIFPCRCAVAQTVPETKAWPTSTICSESNDRYDERRASTIRVNFLFCFPECQRVAIADVDPPSN